MKKKAPVKYESRAAVEPAVLKEVAAVSGWGDTISVRSAKAHLSGLLELVSASGKEIVITSDGKPKARVVPLDTKRRRKVFLGAAAHLKSMPKQTEGPWAGDIIRADRDGRGW